jgi:crotonobetainyl-CoA:carnitine CoA-transferase CaiB-like acyl-CoA transferase
MNASGAADREPVKLVGNAVLMQSGATACTATLAAHLHAELTGRGQHVDVATFETQCGSLDRRRYYLLSHAYSGATVERAVTVGAGRPTAGGRFECADGGVVTTGRIWSEHVARMVAVLDEPELTACFGRHGIDCMAEAPELVNESIARWAATRPARGAMREAQRGGWPVVVSNDPLLLLDDEHLRARGFWVNATHPVAGELAHCGAPFRLDGGGWRLRAPAPLLGQHTDAVLAELVGLGAVERAALREAGVVA